MTDKIKRISGGQANVYLIRGQKGSILIDAGISRYRKKIARVCSDASVKLIVLTHGHFDHCQNAAYLSEKLNCPVGIGKEDAAMLFEEKKRKVYGKGIWGSFYAGVSNWSIRHNKIEPVRPDVILEEGMSLTKYGVEAAVVSLPGHTKGSIGILLKDGTLFVGDAMQNVFSPSVTWCYEDRESALRSVEAIKTIKAEKICYGHGKESDTLIDDGRR